MTSLSIIRSPNFAKKNIQIPFMAPFIKYMKYLPFLSLAFTSFFPASINLYWFTLAGYQLMMTEMMYMKWVSRLFYPTENSDKGKKRKVDRAIFVAEGKTSE